MSVTSYDGLWKSAWGDVQALGPVHRHIRQDMLRVVSSLDLRTVLDVGCGSGDNLAALATARRFELAGVDISAEALAIAGQRVPSARLARLDVEQAALPERFDLVMSIQVIEHVLDDLAALRHMAAMASRYVFVSTMQGRMRRSEIAIGHLRNYSRVELHRKLERAGLEPVRTYGWGFPFYSPLYRSLIEWVPGGPPGGPMGRVSRAVARALYQLYRLNWPGRGDVIAVLARPVAPQ
jgi:SAM-dependent methyltransferase